MLKKNNKEKIFERTLSRASQKIRISHHAAIVTAFKNVLNGCVDFKTNENLNKSGSFPTGIDALPFSRQENENRNILLEKDLKILRSLNGIKYYKVKGTYFEQVDFLETDKNLYDSSEGLMRFIESIYQELQKTFLDASDSAMIGIIKPFNKSELREKIMKTMDHFFERGQYLDFNDELIKSSLTDHLIKKLERNAMKKNKEVFRKYFNEDSFLIINSSNMDPIEFYELAIKLGKKYCQESVLLIFPPTPTVNFSRGILYGTNAIMGIGNIVYLGRLKQSSKKGTRGSKGQEFTFINDNLAEKHPIYSLHQGLE